MKYLHTFFLPVLAILLFTQVSAQRVTVSEQSVSIEKIQRTGLATTLELDKKDVKDLWKKHIKDYGKLEKLSGDVMVINTARIPSVSSNAVKVYTSISSSGKGTMVWMAVDVGDAFVVSGHPKYGAVEKILKDFGISTYKEDIQEQIADAEKALEKSEKDHEKVVKTGENLVGDLEKNAKEKADLEKSLEENASQKVQLEKEIEQNKKDQSSAKQTTEKMKKAVEVVKAKLNDVH